MITAGMEREFAMGHLYAQGIISGISDITSLTVTGTDGGGHTYQYEGVRFRKGDRWNPI
jgi:formate dehydrogenase assembly factor FdhD